MDRIYDRQGNPITTAEWGRLVADDDYRRIGLTEIGPYTVSTVWLGLDHSFREGPPVIFETMVFTTSAWNTDRTEEDHELLLEIDAARYHTEQEAITGHEDMCTLVRATLDDQPPTEPLRGSNGGSEGPDVAYLVAYSALNTL